MNNGGGGGGIIDVDVGIVALADDDITAIFK
jgi:hypothetical protein